MRSNPEGAKHLEVLEEKQNSYGGKSRLKKNADV